MTAWSRVEWRGELYDVAEPPAVHGQSRARHWTLELQRGLPSHHAARPDILSTVAGRLGRCPRLRCRLLPVQRAAQSERTRRAPRLSCYGGRVGALRRSSCPGRLAGRCAPVGRSCLRSVEELRTHVGISARTDLSPRFSGRDGSSRLDGMPGFGGRGGGEGGPAGADRVKSSLRGRVWAWGCHAHVYQDWGVAAVGVAFGRDPAPDPPSRAGCQP